jgi:hypothetical protein
MSITNAESSIIPHNIKLKGRKMVESVSEKIVNVARSTKSTISMRDISIANRHVAAIWEFLTILRSSSEEGRYLQMRKRYHNQRGIDAIRRISADMDKCSRAVRRDRRKTKVPRKKGK